MLWNQHFFFHFSIKVRISFEMWRNLATRQIYSKTWNCPATRHSHHSHYFCLDMWLNLFFLFLDCVTFLTYSIESNATKTCEKHSPKQCDACFSVCALTHKLPHEKSLVTFGCVFFWKFLVAILDFLFPRQKKT